MDCLHTVAEIIMIMREEWEICLSIKDQKRYKKSVFDVIKFIIIVFCINIAMKFARSTFFISDTDADI